MKKIIITSGGTREHIDDFRVLTNISSGKLGCVLIENIAKLDLPYEIVHVRTRYSEKPNINNTELNNLKYSAFEVESAIDAFNVLKDNVPHADVVIHAMAVADFGFKKENNIKLKSNDPDGLVEYIKNNIIVNPKIISHFREWNENIYIIGFKFEISKTEEELVSIARDSLLRNKSNMVIANDKEMMNVAKEHIAFAVTKDSIDKLYGKKYISEFIINQIGKLV